MKKFNAIVFLSIIALLFAPGMILAADSAHGATGGADHAGGSAGLPPTLNQGVITAVTALIVFVLLVIVLSKTAWGPISKGLQEREDKIRNDIKNAEDARMKAEASLRQYQAQLATAESQVRQLLAQAQQDAEKIATNVKMQSQQDAEEIKEKATKDIEAAKNTAVREVYETAATLSTNIAEKIIRRNLNAQDQADLVTAGIEQFQTTASKN